MTPKGKRIGDLIREQLADSNSQMSQCVRTFRAWSRLMKSDPKRYQVRVNYFGDIEYADIIGNDEQVTPSFPLDIGCLIT